MYKVKQTEVRSEPGYWSKLNIEIFKDDDKIGEYLRNYSAYGESTFAPFTQDGQDYALYSRDYTSTRIMKLPFCEDWCGEERDACGFCPVEYYVPEQMGGRYAFVAGCVWGDDSSWKIQFLDLTKIAEKVMIRNDWFGHVELPDNQLLKEAVHSEYFEEGGGFTLNVMLRLNHQRGIADSAVDWIATFPQEEVVKLFGSMHHSLCDKCGGHKNLKFDAEYKCRCESKAALVSECCSVS